MEEVSFGVMEEEDQGSSTVVHDWNRDKEETKRKITQKRCMLVIQEKPLVTEDEIIEFVKWTDAQAHAGHFYAGRFKWPTGQIGLITNMIKANAMEALSGDKFKMAQAIKKEMIRKRKVDSVSHDEDGQEWYWDDMSGQALNSELVKTARALEMKYFKEYRVYEKVPEQECWYKTGHGPIGTKWIDVNKGDEINPEYRSRLVAQEIKTDKSQELFAGTPPLEAKKMLMSLATTQGVGIGQGAHLKLDFIDICRAYFNAAARREVFVKLPPEDHEEGMVGKLLKSMYGTRDAAQNWETEYREFMIKHCEFSQCRSTPCMFWHKERELRVVIHGDDFTVLGAHDNLMWFRKMIKERFEAKFRGMLGPSNKDDKQVTILNRTVNWTREGITYKADHRHVEIIIKDLGLESAKSAATPCVEKKDLEGQEDELEDQRSLRYRSCVTRINYLAQDRSDIQYAAKELCRFMSKPTEADWKKLIRMGRYLKGHKEVVHKFKYQKSVQEVQVWTDSDHAGCHRTRKSTSGGVIMLGHHMIKSWSTTQSVIALSSGEAEYYSMVKGGSVGLGVQAMLTEIGVSLNLVLKCDASAAVGIVMRRGLGRVRHIDLSQLWLQEKVAQGGLKVHKVKTDENKSDALTKYLGVQETEKHLRMTSQEFIVQ